MRTVFHILSLVLLLVGLLLVNTSRFDERALGIYQGHINSLRTLELVLPGALLDARPASLVIAPLEEHASALTRFPSSLRSEDKTVLEEDVETCLSSIVSLKARYLAADEAVANQRAILRALGQNLGVGSGTALPLEDWTNQVISAALAPGLVLTKEALQGSLLRLNDALEALLEARRAMESVTLAPSLDQLERHLQEIAVRARDRATFSRWLASACLLSAVLLWPGGRYFLRRPPSQKEVAPPPQLLSTWADLMAPVTDAVLLLEGDARIVNLNASALTLLRVPEVASVLGADAVTLLFPPDARDEWKRRVTRTLSGDEVPAEATETLIIAGSTEIPAQVYISRARVGDEDRVCLYLRDRRDQLSVAQLKSVVRASTTRLARSALELKISEARKSAILEAALDCIIGLDDHFLIIELNPSTERTLSGSRDELLGSSLYDWIRRPPHSNPLEKSGLTPPEGSSARFEVPLGERVEVICRRTDGTQFPAELSLARIEVEGPAQFTAYMTDITERKRVDGLKNEFISIVSHELRTPLTSIRGSLGLIEGGVVGMLEPPVRDLIKIARNNCERLIRLVNDMLDLEKMSAGRVELRLEPLDICDLVSAACSGVSGFAEELDVRLEQQCAKIPVIQGDRDRLIQVVTNLLSNAIKFSPKGASVLVTASHQLGQRVRISVSDHGPGIPEDQLSRLFIRFQQLEVKGERVKRGSGLGLAISKAIVTLHGGKMDVTSQPGVGSTFSFEVPLEAKGRPRTQEVVS